MISSAYTRFDNSSGINGDGSLLLTGVSLSDSLGLKGSGLRGLKGSGLRGLKGSGLRSVTYENDNSTVVDYGIPLLALGPVSSIDKESGAISILGQELLSNVVYSKLALGGFPAVDCAFINTVDELHAGNHISELPEST